MVATSDAVKKNGSPLQSGGEPFKIPLFKSGDIGGIVYMFAGNIGNFILVAATLLGFGWSKELVFGKVIPGISLGLMVQGLYYAWMAYRLAKKERRTDVCALPSGLSTPAVFVFLYGVIMPLQHGLGLAPEKVWTAAVAACFLGGAIESVGGLIGPTIRKYLPRAAMLATVAGIALVWMATKGLYDVYATPILGMPILIIAILGLIGGYMLPRKISPLLVALVFGIVYALFLGESSINVENLGSITLPTFSLGAVFTGFGMIIPFLAIIIPIEIYNFIETMDNVESAAAAGDEYNVAEAQAVDGGCTMISAIFGGIMPNTVWLGHVGLKSGGSGIGFSWISGLLFGVCGFFGVFEFLYHLMPEVLIAVTYLWCAIIMVTQAFNDSPRRYGAAIALALVPHMANYAYTEVMMTLGSANIYELTPAVNEALKKAGVMWGGVEALSNGAILTGMIWASIMVFIIDRRLDKAAIMTLIAAFGAAIGLLHGSQISLNNIMNPFVIGYLSIAAIMFVVHIFRDKLEVPTRFDYV